VNEGYWVVQVKGPANPEYVVLPSKADTAVKTPVVRRAGRHKRKGNRAPLFRVSMGTMGKFDAASEVKTLEVGNIYLFGRKHAREPKYFLVKAPFSVLVLKKLKAELLAEALAAEALAAAARGGGGGGGGGGQGRTR